MDTNKIKINPTFHEQLENNGKWRKESDPRYMAYRQKWTEYPKKFIVEKAPIHLDIETASICNLRCPMCIHTIELEKGKDSAVKQGLMEMPLFQRIIDEAAEIGVSSVKLNWRGEPTMNGNLADMVRYAKKKGLIDIMINTNAVALDRELSKDLIDAGLDKIFFSVDSIHPEKYAAIRVGAEFEKVMGNIRYFAECNEQAGHPVYTRVQKVLMTDTDNENEEFKGFFGSIVDQVAFEDYIPYGGKGYGKDVDRGGVIRFSCSQLWQRMLITWDGECRACCISSNKPFIMGNVNMESIADIWNGKQLGSLRAMHQAGEWYRCELCKECYTPYM